MSAADLRCVALTRHPLSEAMHASLTPPYTVYQVQARWDYAREAWLDACLVCGNHFPDVVILVMPAKWACWFVAFVGGISPDTTIIRPVMDGRDRWMGRWTAQWMADGKMRYRWWTPEGVGER